MARIYFGACILGVLAVGFTLAQSQTSVTKAKVDTGPDLGFDYRALIADHQTKIAAGEADKAVELLAAHARHPKAFTGWAADDLKRKFSVIYGGLGKLDSHEIIGYRQLSPRLVVFYVLSHYQNGVLQFTYGFQQWEGEWKCAMFSIQENMEEMAKNVPFQPMRDQ